MPDDLRTERRRQRQHCLSFVVLFVLAALVPVQEGFADEIRCKCSFAQPPWEAYGTRAACTAVTGKGKTSCNISFGGTGADPKIVSQVLGVSPGAYESQVNKTLITFLQAMENRVALLRPEFIRTALPVFMRGAYLREGVSEDLKTLDRAVVTFSEKNAQQISDSFLGAKPPFTAKELGANFSVGAGTVIVDYKDIQIITVFLPSPK